VYVANFGSGTVSAIATASNTVTSAAVTVGTEPGGLAVTPDGRRVYVSNQGSGTVHVIDTASNTVTGAPIAVGGHPTGLAITPDGHRVYVPDFQLNRVSVIDTATNAVIATVPANNGPFGAAVTPDGRSAYVANFGSGTVSAIDTASNSVTAIVSVGTFPFRLAITPDGRRLYVTNQESGTATVIPTLPVVNAITPTQGPTIGGTQVTIAGTMLSGATAVHFGSSPASSLFVDAAGTQALAVAPVGGAGPVPVTVTTPGGTSRPVSFTYFVPAPTISAIAPAQGPTTGGTQVIITGSNLDGATAVKFGTVPATNVLVNPGGTQVIAHGPVGSAGTVPVTVTTPGGTSNPVSFTYLVPPTISALTPPQGRVAGGTQVTIDGTNMNGATAVNFGPNPAPCVFSGCAAGTLLITTSPAGTAGEVPVTVTTPAGTSNPVTYTYV
jgi:YVTN family beta-propeller protein